MSDRSEQIKKMISTKQPLPKRSVIIELCNEIETLEKENKQLKENTREIYIHDDGTKTDIFGHGIR